MNDVDQKAIDHFRKQDAEVQAASMPLPGPAGDASASGPIEIKVGEKVYSVRKIIKYDWRVWQQTGNAIVLSMRELLKPESERNPIADDVSDTVAVWMLTHTCEEVDAALKYGVESFKKRCISDFEYTLEPCEFAPLFDAVMEQLKRSAATAIKYAAKEKEGEDGTIFFRDTRDSQKTASAG